MNVERLLEESKTIAVVLPLGAPANDTQEALLLACGLKKLGKQVSIEHSQAPLEAPSPNERTFVVSLKGLAPRVARLRYEKDAKDLKLYFTLSRGELFPEALSLQLQNQADLTIIVGDQPLERNNGQLPSVNVLSAGEAKQSLLNLLRSQENAQARILGMALSQLEYISRLDLYLIALHEEHLQSMNLEYKNLPLLIPDLRGSFGDQSSYLFLFDSPFGAQGMLWSSSPNLRTKLRDMSGGQQKGFWVLLRPTPLSSEQLKHAFLS